MKQISIIILSVVFALTAFAIKGNTAPAQPTDSTIFKVHLDNKEYQVWLDIDFYNNNIIVPKQEVFGPVPGYLGAVRDTRKWIISDAIVKGRSAQLTIINDYGSEDLKARLTLNADSTYTFEQMSGSTIKIVVDNKWLKLPKKLIFTRKK